jgi:hypothetical protein
MPLPLRELVDQPRLVNERAQSLDWDELLFEYERALDDDLAFLAGLSAAQVHFKPSPTDFSIGEVLTHAIDSDRLFWGWIKLLTEGRRAEINPADLIAGDGADNTVMPEVLRGEIEAGRALARMLIDQLPAAPDLTATSPHPYFGEMNGKGWIYFMLVHHGLHLRQCERVLDAPGFPPGESVQSLPVDEYLRPRNRKTWLAQADQANKRMSDKAKKKPAARRKPAGQKKPSDKKTTAKR